MASAAANADPASFSAVVMAGGFGSRLQQVANGLPKPMLPVGGRPLLELIVDRLRAAGARRVHLATHYRGELISGHFGDGRPLGVDIRYLEEREPLGTAGALALLRDDDEPLLVMNGDVLAAVDFRALWDFHRGAGADLTVAVRDEQLEIPYGVLELDGANVTAVHEKPLLRYAISAGVYVLSPTARRVVPRGRRFDMPDLVGELLRTGRRVAAFPHEGYWIDVGRPDDYERAQEDWRTGRARR
jgi:NDP-sugar pyrophosphorylase family protein